MTSSTQKEHPLRNVLDVLIIGGGPAGLSAALALGRILRSAILFDSGEYRNESSSYAHTIPLHDHQNPAEMRLKMKEELQHKYKTIVFAESPVETVRDTNGIFEVVDTVGKVWKGRKVILASGSYDVLPDIPGYKESWGKGILHCPFCRGFEEVETGLSSAAILITEESSAVDIENLLFYGQILRQFTDNITVLLNGHAQLASHAKLSAVALACGMRMNARAIQKLRHNGQGASMTVTFSDSTEDEFGLVFHKPQTCLRGNFARQLGLELTSSGDLKVSIPMQQTSRRGVFAAGDCSTFIKQVAVAIGTGVSAGIAANFEIVMDDLADGFGQG